MEQGELLLVIGSRAVCQADCSGVGYPKVRAVININADLSDVAHYNSTLALPGDIGVAISQLLRALPAEAVPSAARQSWLDECAAMKRSGSASCDCANWGSRWQMKCGNVRC